MKAQVNKLTIEVVLDDIYALSVNGLVNATDTNLSLPSILAAKAGVSVQREITNVGWCEVGSAVATGAGALPYNGLIHAVGPRWGEGSERGKLANVTWECLRLAESKQMKSIAIPAISAGTLGYPLENCAATMLAQIIDFSFENLKYLRKVIICLDNQTAFEVFQGEFAQQLEELKNAGEGKVKV